MKKPPIILINLGVLALYVIGLSQFVSGPEPIMILMGIQIITNIVLAVKSKGQEGAPTKQYVISAILVFISPLLIGLGLCAFALNNL